MARFDLDAEWGQPALVPLDVVQDRKAERHHSHVRENRGAARELSVVKKGEMGGTIRGWKNRGERECR
jgi:hypothetical protein